MKACGRASPAPLATQPHPWTQWLVPNRLADQNRPCLGILGFRQVVVDDLLARLSRHNSCQIAQGPSRIADQFISRVRMARASDHGRNRLGKIFTCGSRNSALPDTDNQGAVLWCASQCAQVVFCVPVVARCSGAKFKRELFACNKLVLMMRLTPLSLAA